MGSECARLVHDCSLQHWSEQPANRNDLSAGQQVDWVDKAGTPINIEHHLAAKRNEAWCTHTWVNLGGGLKAGRQPLASLDYEFKRINFTACEL